MKIYWFSISLFYFIWLLSSQVYFSEPAWWSIFSSDRSTHTSSIEHISLVKVAMVALPLLGLSFHVQRMNLNRNQQD